MAYAIEASHSSQEKNAHKGSVPETKCRICDKVFLFLHRVMVVGTCQLIFVFFSVIYDERFILYSFNPLNDLPLKYPHSRHGERT